MNLTMRKRHRITFTDIYTARVEIKSKNGHYITTKGKSKRKKKKFHIACEIKQLYNRVQSSYKYYLL